MAYFSEIFVPKNNWNRTTTVKIIVDGWVVSFFFLRHSVCVKILVCATGQQQQQPTAGRQTGRETARRTDSDTDRRREKDTWSRSRAKVSIRLYVYDVRSLSLCWALSLEEVRACRVEYIVLHLNRRGRPRTCAACRCWNCSLVNKTSDLPHQGNAECQVWFCICASAWFSWHCYVYSIEFLCTE